MRLWSWRRRRDEELDEEIRSHLAMATRDRVERGEDPEEAAAAARRELGNVGRVKEVTRETWGWLWLEQLGQDVRFGVRTMIKHRAYTAVAVLALGIGIGANTAILSTVNCFLVRPLPVERPGELVVLQWGNKADDEVWGEFSHGTFVDLREQNRSLSGLVATTSASAAVSADDGGQPEVVSGEIVSGNYFDVLGVRPSLGRGFLPEEDHAQGGPPVVVLSYSLWQRRFASDAAILGKAVSLNGSPFTVVGVAPEGFVGVRFASREDFWAPLMTLSKFGLGETWETNRGWRFLDPMGRLRPGVTAAQAEADLNLVVGQLAEIHPEATNSKVRLVSEVDSRFGEDATFFKFVSVVALCVSGLVLLVACANVANLMLARAVARAREMGVRLAIGASRFRLVRQLLTESLLLAVLGGTLGWVLARWGTGLVRASTPPAPFPIVLDVAPDLTVLGWTAVVSLLAGVVFGLVPAVAASRPDLVAVIKGDLGARSRQRPSRIWNVRGLLVMAQVAISVVVLVSAGLLIRSLGKILQADPGYVASDLVTMQLDTGLAGIDNAASERFYEELVRRVEARPGVESASLAAFLPMGDGNSLRDNILKEGEPNPPPNEGRVVWCNVVRPGYFETVRTSLMMGRDFTERDTADSPRVVIVSQEFARELYGSEEAAMGQRFRFWSTDNPLMEIVGIAEDGRYRSLYEDTKPYMYLPHTQNYQTGMMLVVRAASPDGLRAVADGARSEIERLDPRLPIFGVHLGDENLSMVYWGPRVAAGMAMTLGLLALLLATVGLYSVVTYAVSQRTREIGVRMALGAQLGDVRRLVLGLGMSMVVVGIGIGLAGALAATRVLSSLLYGVGATDPVTFVGAALLLVAIAAVACWIPARRAAKVDPLVALRYE